MVAFGVKTTNGNEIIFRVVVKPTSSTGADQTTYNFSDGKMTTLKVKGRHDTCIALRIPVIVEAAAAIGAGATIEAAATIGAGATIGAEATIGVGATVEAGASVGVGATVETGATVGAGTTAAASPLVTAWTYAKIGIQAVLNFPAKALDKLMLRPLGLSSSTKLLPALTSSGKAMTMGQAFNIALSTGSAIYSATPYVEARISEAMGQYSRMLNGLGDQEGLREGIFLTTLSKIVDDPNDTQVGLYDWDRDGTKEAGYDCDGDGTLEVGGDPCDSDGDGDTQETVPYFQFWLDRRFNAIKNATANAFGFVDSFWADITNFKDYAKETILKDDNSPNYLSRQEIEGADGEIVGFVRALENSGHPVSFWQTGPTSAEFEEWGNNCGGGEEEWCPPDYLSSRGYDELDSMVDDFSSFAA